MNYYPISAEDLGKEAKIPILKLGDSAEIFYELASVAEPSLFVRWGRLVSIRFLSG